MAKVAVVATMKAREGKRNEVVQALSALVEAAAKEQGTEVYVLHTVQDDPDAIVFYELYADADALAAHGGSDTMKQVGGSLRDLLAGRPEITRLTPEKGSGLALS